MLAIIVPPLGESIVEATVSRWLKKEGESVRAGETLVELETDKVTVEVPALKAGILSKRSHAEGDVVKVGDKLGEVQEGAVTTPVAATTPVSTSAQPTPATVPVAPAAPAVPIAPPAGLRISPSAQRYAAESGIDLSAVAGSALGGVISKQDVMQQSGGTPPSSPRIPTPAAAPAVSPAPVPPRTPTPAATSPVAPTPLSVPSAPALPGSPALSATGGAARETRETMSTRRKRIAEHLLEAQHQTAHLTTFNEIDMSAVTALREKTKERIEKEHGVKLSFMPFFVRAATLALKDFPVVNGSIEGDSIVYHHYVNMGIAVASNAGLVVPNLKDVQEKGLLQIAREMNTVATRAREGKLTMDDLTGGTFTITNGGVFGSLLSTPILNFPQSGILGLHKTQDRPVAIDGQVVVRPMMYVALSYDHRIIDGQQAVLFLVRVKELMEDPTLMAFDWLLSGPTPASA